MLDLAHVGRLRVAIEELPHRLAGVVTGLVEGLSHETIAGAVLRAMIAHPVRQLTRGPAIAATPYKAMPIRLVRFRSGQVRSNPLLQRKRRAMAPRSTPFPSMRSRCRPLRPIMPALIRCRRARAWPLPKRLSRRSREDGRWQINALM